MQQNREEDFQAGLRILEPFFSAEGFELRLQPPFTDEDGTYYSAQFVWDKRVVTLIHFFGLRAVAYSVGGMMIDHLAYLTALGVQQDAAYPTSSEDPVAGYHALLSDLETRMAPFFEEPDREFMEIAATHGQRIGLGLPGLPG